MKLRILMLTMLAILSSCEGYKSITAIVVAKTPANLYPEPGSYL
ncbi:hypothetical protein [Mucilaginibacter sp. PPCGB 2223]|nr:hypothetical protein [Mucilaginibacter sp. PPCGB 2223]